MTKEKIINMVIEAGAYRTKKYPEEWHLDGDDLRRFAKLVAKKEREECWNIVFDYAARDDLTPEDESLLKHIADLIQERGQQ